MKQAEDEKFMIDRHPTIGDAADRRVPEPDPSVHHGVEQVLPLMRDVEIGRNTAIGLIVCFLFMITVPGLWALLSQLSPDSALRQNWNHRGSPEANKAMTSALLDESDPSRWMRRTWGANLTAITGDRVANVLIGKDGFLFYLPDFDACMTAPMLSPTRPDAVTNIVDYDKAMRARGIHLVVMPIPCKTAIVPWKLAPAYPQSAGPAMNPDYRKWIAKLQSSGIDVLDMTDEFWNLSIHGDIPYQPQDSHWTPQAMELAATRLADHVSPWLGSYNHISYATRAETIVTQGDLVGLLGLAGDTRHWPPMSLRETQVLIGGKPAEVSDDAKVLLIGDSYTEMGTVKERWSRGAAGLPDQLMLRLGADVQFIAGSGALFPGAREALSKRPEALANKKVVVWEFTARNIPTDSVPLPLTSKLGYTDHHDIR